MRRLLATFAALALCTACAPRQIQPASQSEVKPKPETEAAVMMASMSEEEMAAKMKEYATPGEAHAALQPLIGKWSTTTKFWKDPGAEPQITRGTATHEWMLGKRFLKEDYRGEFFGQPFTGLGTLGYDNASREYVSTWVDTMGTGIMTAKGTFDAKANFLEFESRFTCPLTSQELKNRYTTRILNKNEHVLEMYATTPDGKEYKSMEIVYKRKG